MQRLSNLARLSVNVARNQFAVPQRSNWSIKHVNHIAVATNNLIKASSFYRDILGARVGDPQLQEEHGVFTSFVELDGAKIELLFPYGDDSPIKEFLKRNPDGGIHHICLEVDDIVEATASLRALDIRLLSETSKIGAHGKPVIFVHPKDCNGVLIELQQSRRKKLDGEGDC